MRRKQKKRSRRELNPRLMEISLACARYQCLSVEGEVFLKTIRANRYTTGGPCVRTHGAGTPSTINYRHIYTLLCHLVFSAARRLGGVF